MSKRRDHLVVSEDLSNVFDRKLERKQPKSLTTLSIEKALSTVIRQMRATGLRERTIFDYKLHISNFMSVTGTQYLEELNVNHIYEWLSSMNVKNQTKLTRLKCLKAFLGRCRDNGWIDINFWKNVKIKVDTPVKEGATDREINLLLSMLDLTRFLDLRDATAILLMYQTGIRVGTLAQLEHKHVNLDAKILSVDGGIIKNHESIFLPFDDTLVRLLGVLMKQNEIIRREHNVKNDYLFITRSGGSVMTRQTTNIISKRMTKHARDYGLKNINPHALRRGFAKNLLQKGANIALISKALGHSDIAVTTRYLHLDKNEVAESLRNFL
ncbi:tyrosine-type recombinase/integrase [Bacillus arachidis]|uniref:Site-specific integrase n=1 Tax=Bacillus arachidis TaxID=2819290 RepID=A0ABS3P4P9_9BACI|nr:site-specific integrase [Bacillus arachidis]MBO1627811.1 site-specific integrase [Bacillus arachidis]